MPCPIEIRKVIENSINELLPNPDAIVAQSSANKVVKELNTMWSSAIARVIPYSGEGGAYVKINPLEDAIDKEYKRQLDAEKAFERDFDFFRGDQALLEQERRDLFLQATAPIKPGVQELFNTNPELASVGTPEQYSAYIDSIFPESKVKDVLYHGSPIKGLQEIKRGTDNQGKMYTSKYGITFTNNDLTASIYAGQISLDPNIEDDPDIGQVYPVLLNLKNFATEDFNNESYGGKFGSAISTYNNALEKAIENNKDGFIAKNIADPVQNQNNYVVFKPEQIHILGNENDIKGFKKFVSNQGNLFLKRSGTVDDNSAVIKNLNQQLIDGFLKDFNITASEYENLKQDVGIDALTASDLVTKSIAYKKGESILPEVAYFAYSILGKQNNKLRSELRYLVNKWGKYKERFDYHSKQIKSREGFIEDSQEWKNKIRDLVILDFLQEKMSQYYLNPTGFEKSLDTKWTREDFSLWNKIVQFFEDILSNFSDKYKNSEKKLSDIGTAIADEILNNNYEYFNYELKDDQIQKYYNRTIESDPFAKELVEFGQKELGIVLTGSLALRRAGTVYRTEEETLHDIDWVVPFELNSSEENKNVLEKIKAYQGIDKNVSAVAAQDEVKNFNWFKKFQDRYPNFKIINSFYGAEHQAYESLTTQGVIDGEFYEEDGYHEEEISYYKKDPETKKPIKVKEIAKVKHKKGDWIKDTGYVIDFFIRLAPNQEEHENYFKLWKEIMIAKIKMGRDKDFTDWKAFVPYMKSKDSFNFNYEGFRHINYSTATTSLDQPVVAQNTAEETLPPVASPETLKLVKDFLKRIGVDVKVMKEIVVNGIKYDANGVAQITQQLISVVEGKEAQALPEEAMHFAVSIIKQTNPKLYQKLMKEINGYNMLNSVFAEYGNNPLYQKDGKPDVVKLKEEAIAKVLVEKIITGVESTSEKPENLAKAQSWWRDILNWMKSLIYQKSGFDQAAIDIISGKEIGTAKDIRENNAVEFLQQTTQESLFNNIKNTSDRINKQVDQDSAAKEERYFLDGVKKIARRVSDLTKDFFERRRKQQDLVQSEYEKAVTDLKAEKGTNGHLDFEHAFTMFTDENGFLKSPEEIEQLILDDDHISFIDPNDNDIYEILRDNLLERMQAFEAANQAANPGTKTRFLKEVSIYDPSRDIAGTIDFMAITGNGKINILDWKFMGLNTEKYDDIPWYKVQSWRIQMEQYKLILKNNYGVKDQDFGQTRMIPILTKWSKGKPNKNILPRLTDIKIGDVVVKNISEDEGYLIPVATKGELTGNKKIDALLERLNTAYERFSDVKVPASEKKNKAEQLNALFSAIMRLHMQQDVAPLLKQVAILHKQINSLVDLYETRFAVGDPKSFSEDEINTFITNHENATFAIESYIDLYNQLKSIIDPEDKKLVTRLRDISDDSRNYVTELKQINEDFVRDVIAKREGFNFFGMAEKTVKGLSRLFSSTATIQTKAVQLLYRKASEALGFAAMETETESFKLSQLQNDYMAWIKSKGIADKDLFKPIKKKDSNELIDEFKSEFYKNVREKTASRAEADFKWLRENVDVDAYREHLDNLLIQEIERIQSKHRGGTKLEDERDEKREIDKAKNLYSIAKKDSLGWLLSDEIRKFPKRELWESEEWKYLNAPGNEAAKRFYDYIIEKNNEYAELGYIEKRYARIFLPYVRKSLVERVLTNDNIEVGREFMESISIDEGDVGYGETDPLTGKPKRSIPKYFVTKLDETVSDDLFRTMSMYNEMALRYKYLTKIESQLRAVGQVERNKKSIDTSIFGKAKMKNGEPVKIDDNRQNSELYEAMMDAIIYGQKYIQSDVFDATLGKLGNWGKVINEKLNMKIFPEELSERQITVNKVIDNLNNSFQLTALGLNPLSATSSFFGGNVQSLINAGKYFNKTDFLKSEYQLFVNKFNTTLGNETDSAKMFVGALQYFLPLTDNYNREVAKSLSVQGLTQQGMQDFLMILMRKADFAVQMTNFYAFLSNTIIVDGRVVNAREYLREQPEYANKYSGTAEQRAEFEKRFDQQVEKLLNEKGVMKLAKIENGRFVVPGVERMSDSVIDIRRKVQQLNKDALGNLSEDDLRMINMNIMTKSMMVFKNWIPRLVDVRLGQFKYNSASDAYEWGRMRMIFSFLGENLTTNMKGLMGLLSGNEDGIEIIRKAFEKKKLEHFEQTGGEILELDETMFIDLVRENVRAFAYDAAVTLIVFAMAAALKAYLPDDEDERVKNQYKFVVKAADKLKDELLYFWNPTSAASLLKSGIFPSLSLIENGSKAISKFLLEMFAIGTGNTELEEDTKVIKYIMRTFPISNQIVGYLPMFYADLAKDLGIQMQSNYGVR